MERDRTVDPVNGPAGWLLYTRSCFVCGLETAPSIAFWYEPDLSNAIITIVTKLSFVLAVAERYRP